MITMSQQRIQKFLAGLGYGSRRQIEQWIKQGKIKVNGVVAKLGDKVSSKDQIQLDGAVVKHHQKKTAAQVLVLNKPNGYLCSRTPENGKPSVFSLLPSIKAGRWISVGRLDLNSSGLLLFSTDGGLVHKLTHPSSEIEREYLVRVFGALSKEQESNLLTGVDLDGRPAKFSELRYQNSQGSNHWYQVILKEGRYREVRRLFESQGLAVNRLIRTRYGPIRMAGKVKSGHYYLLSNDELNQLYDLFAD